MKTKIKIQNKSRKVVVDIYVDGMLAITGKVMYVAPKGLTLDQKVKRIYGNNYSYQLSKIN